MNCIIGPALSLSLSVPASLTFNHSLHFQLTWLDLLGIGSVTQEASCAQILLHSPGTKPPAVTEHDTHTQTSRVKALQMQRFEQTLVFRRLQILVTFNQSVQIKTNHNPDVLFFFINN